MSETASPPARPRRRRPLRRALGTVLVLVVVLAAGAYLGTRAMEIPRPTRLAQIALSEPSRQGDFFPAHQVPASTRPITFPAGTGDLPDDVPWKGDRISLEEFLENTSSKALVVLQDGELVEEWYADGIDAGTRMNSWSVAKSVISLLIGQAIDRGELSEDDRLVDLVPELKSGSEYDDITVHDLLDMTAGVDVSENYKAYWPFVGAARMLLTTDMPGFLHDNRAVEFTPGSQGAYRSVNTQLLGMILIQIEGKPLADLLSERLWGPMGAQSSATWNLDTDGGVEKAFCCLNATALDFAHLGQLVLDDGQVAGQEVVPAEWIARITTPAEHPVSDWNYSAQWWHPSGGVSPDYTALGVYGQFVYVNPTTRTVVVKLSDHGTEQDGAETLDVLRTLAGQDPTQP
ncbi:serine hydrolase domain-containing protein [Nocardioides dongkuii]|uniref:serine hydrolase domain-containing protein n=1 Tax=Nocardioides dongkuii TaxID=2760089 RepID=UPI001C701816|nr:serine hydrolase [Nocardioides dongkuii]